MSFRFHDPLWFVALLPVAAILFGAAFARRRSRGEPAAVVFSSVRPLAALPVTAAQRFGRVLPVLRFLGFALLVIALARPQQGRDESRVRQDAIAIELVIDRSGSMEALDFELDGRRANRLAIVKEVVKDFVAGGAGDGGGPELPGRPDDLIGLVVFGGFPESRCPLTFDHGALLAVLEAVQIAGTDATPEEKMHGRELIAEARGTAIGDALAVAVERLRNVEATSKVIVLLSDGEQTAGVLLPEQGAELAKTEGIRIYSVGIGSTGIVPIRVVDQFGRERLVQDQVRLDEATLRRVAEVTGGHYANARTTEQLRDVYAQIDRLERTEIERTVYTEYQERFELALLPGLALLLLDLLLRCTRFRTLP
jgi:Ca-activated chloride channel family protein